MKKQTKDFLFDLLWNVCFSNTFMCNILQKDYSFTPLSHTHSLSLVYSFTTHHIPHPVSIYHSPSLSLIWLVGFNDGSLNGGLISLLAVWSAAVHTLEKQPECGAPVGLANQLWRQKKNPTGATGLLCSLVWIGGLSVCLSVCLSCRLSFYQAFQTDRYMPMRGLLTLNQTKKEPLTSTHMVVLSSNMLKRWIIETRKNQSLLHPEASHAA